jgi:hypothetical protein
MNKKIRSAAVFSFSVVVASLPTLAQADFIIEFMDGRTVTVGRYFEERQTIKIYSASGTIGFSKVDIKRITEVQAKQSKQPRLETVSTRPAQGETASSERAEDVKKEEAGSSDTGTADKPHTQTEGKGASAEAKLEAMGQRYQEVTHSLNTRWQSHSEKMKSGASPEEISESRKQLLEVEDERQELLKAASKVDPDRRPAWAQ